MLDPETAVQFPIQSYLITQNQTEHQYNIFNTGGTPYKPNSSKTYNTNGCWWHLKTEAVKRPSR